ncbi:hypothetical protein SEVIR_3G359433v4 [Setaria viridis]
MNSAIILRRESIWVEGGEEEEWGERGIWESHPNFGGRPMIMGWAGLVAVLSRLKFELPRYDVSAYVMLVGVLLAGSHGCGERGEEEEGYSSKTTSPPSHDESINVPTSYHSRENFRTDLTNLEAERGTEKQKFNTFLTSQIEA